MQYNLFKETETDRLRQEVLELRLAQANMRRGLFARHGELQRKIEALQAELEGYKQVKAGKKAELVPFFGEYLEVTK